MWGMFRELGDLTHSRGPFIGGNFVALILRGGGSDLHQIWGKRAGAPRFEMC